MRDWVWGGIAAAFLALFLRGALIVVLYWLRVGFGHDEFFFLTGIPATIASTVVSAVVGSWLILGAWRRTVWGAPPAGQRDHIEMRHLDREPPES